ncbi:MAG: ABC transporter permease, partial [Chloroflexi bacterium]|nr:ABC transporter permease [Chloroflexota bacterium]
RFGVPLGVRTGLGDAFSRPIRAWLTVLAIGTLGASAVATLTFEATISGFVSQPARVGISPFDLVVSAAGGDRASTLAGVTALAAARDDVRAIVYRSVWWLNLPTDGIRLDSTSDRYERVLTRALSGDIAGSGIPVVSGRLPAAPGEVAVGIGLARRFGIHDGDRLPTTFVGDSTQLPLPLRVVGTIADASNDARVLLVTADTFAGVAGASAVPDEIAWRLDSPASVASVRTAISNAFGASVQIDESRAHLLADITATRDDLRPVLFGLNGLLFAIAALNLLLILVISVRERRRELATLRALGFTPRQLGVGVLASAGLLGAAGVAVGAPTGYALVRWLLDGVAHDAGWQAGAVATPGPLAWRLLVGVAIAVAVAAAAVPAWLAIRGPVADGMRAE